MNDMLNNTGLWLSIGASLLSALAIHSQLFKCGLGALNEGLAALEIIFVVTGEVEEAVGFLSTGILHQVVYC